MVYAIMIFHIVGWGCSGPAIQALASRAVPANEQGLVQGVLMSIATATGDRRRAGRGGDCSVISSALHAPFVFPGDFVRAWRLLFLVGSSLRPANARKCRCRRRPRNLTRRLRGRGISYGAQRIDAKARRCS